MLTYISLNPQLEARAIRITPKEFQVDIDMKVEVYGKPICRLLDALYNVYSTDVYNC